LHAPEATWQQADAMHLPFDDARFDVVVCQFGVMFYPDKVKGNAEARRVLRDGGRYLLAIWDRIERNMLSNLANRSMHELFPDDPPKFMERGPFSYYDPEWIERDLTAAGFANVEIETIELTSRSPTAEDAARGLTYGSPMGVELEEYGPGAVDQVFDDFWRAARQYEGPAGFEAPMRAHIVTATK
jgi:SAM-dependent methyltransferase